jgi:hypothetical protein
MAAGPFLVTNEGLLRWLDRTINLGGTIKAVLIDNAHTPDLETDDTYADISADECQDVDYAPQTVTNFALTRTAGVTKVDADAVPFGNPVTIAARYIYLVFQAGGTLAGTDLVFGYMDLNDGGSANVSSSNSEFTVDWNVANGLCLVQQV